MHPQLDLHRMNCYEFQYQNTKFIQKNIKTLNE